MLRNLHIKNLALIREIDVDFSEGLNILTGETGAGKSIIIGSLMTALGTKFPRTMLRDDAPYALVEMVFEVTDEKTLAALRAQDIEPEDGMVIISRKIEEGRSLCRINGVTVSSSAVRACAELLIDIHGQHENQQLLKNERQLALLDDYGRAEIQPARARVQEDYQRYVQLKQALARTGLSEEERTRRIQLLSYEIDEIEGASLKEGEDEELERSYRKLSNSQRIAGTMNEVHEMSGYDSDEGAGETVGRALKLLEGVCEFDPAIEELAASLKTIDGLLNDFNRDASEYMDSLSDQSETLAETEERLNLINRLKAKYGREIRLILEGLKERKEELENLENLAQNRKKAEEDFRRAEDALRLSSDRLSALRKKTGASFSREASAQLADLNFAKADFAVDVKNAGHFGADGQDNVEFMISTNPGEPRMPLAKIASGGELSRVMLGIRTMFAKRDDTGTLVFDEIDAGISGRTAQKVAEKLVLVSRAHQTLCITHLPQIAAMADVHYAITKDVSADAAVTKIDVLSDEESVGELARLIGGAKITDNTLESAAEMKEMGRQYKAKVV